METYRIFWCADHEDGVDMRRDSGRRRADGHARILWRRVSTALVLALALVVPVASGGALDQAEATPRREGPEERLGSGRRDRPSGRDGTGGEGAGFDPEADWAEEAPPVPTAGSMAEVTGTTGARDLWARGITGRGVGVAMIDTGVVPVRGLDAPGKVVNGPDLSFDSQFDHLTHLDGYGHGTHMAGIAVGSDNPLSGGPVDDRSFQGMAPGAHLVNVKVGAQDGAVDVSQVIAAIEWVIAHRADPGVNIRVLNLSFGTDGLQDSAVDPLSYAVEQAWRAGIVVVVSAGNSGRDLPRLLNPAVNPYVLAVGAADTRGTRRVADDIVPEFSSRGDAARGPDLVAPGQSIVSLRAPGSMADDLHPDARVEGRFFRGTGTSQAAAVVSGGVALLVQERPELTPDGVKALLTTTAQRMPRADREGRGAGFLDVAKASRKKAPEEGSSEQDHPRAVGTGLLEGARGSSHVVHEGVELTGEVDVFGAPWDGAAWAAGAAAGTNWDGGTWRGHELTGTCFCGTSFAAVTWARASWRDDSWARASWRDEEWARASWRDGQWVRASWRDGQWVRASWREEDWLRASWRRASWRDDTW